MTDAALLNFVHDGGKGIVWFHGSAAQEPDWGYPEEYNVMRGVDADRRAPGCGPGRGARRCCTRLSRGIRSPRAVSATWTVTGDDILTGVAGRRQCAGAAHGLRRPRGVREARRCGRCRTTRSRSRRRASLALPGMNTHQPIAWINEYGSGRSFTITIGHDIDTFRRIEFIRMFPRGVEWAATGEVVAATVRIGAASAASCPWPYYNREG